MPHPVCMGSYRNAHIYAYLTLYVWAGHALSPTGMLIRSASAASNLTQNLLYAGDEMSVFGGGGSQAGIYV